MRKTTLTQPQQALFEQKPPFGLAHVAFIMDGNGRWAKARHKPRTYGHQVGFKRVKEIAQACRDFGIKCMSLYAFSTENWKRPQAEIDFLFNYLDVFIKQELANLIKDDCRLVVSGDIHRLPLHSQVALEDALAKTSHCRTFILNMCLNYGGQQEIIKAVRTIAADVQQHVIDADLVDEAYFQKQLYTADLPPLDLLIRTSGEVRLSNFMLYQLAYSEMIFTPTKWPDFKKEQLEDCLLEYGRRTRRYGGL